MEKVATVCLVSCRALVRKRATAGAASDLYQSDWFTKVRSTPRALVATCSSWRPSMVSSAPKAIPGMDRRADLGRLYAVLESLEQALAGKRTLAECNGRMAWPDRGVYFLFEPGEMRSARGRVQGLSGSARTVRSRGPPHHSATPIPTSRDRNYRLGQSPWFDSACSSVPRSRTATKMVEPSSWDIGADPGAAAQSFGMTREEDGGE